MPTPGGCELADNLSLVSFLYGDLKLKESCHCSFMLQSYEIMANPQNYSLSFFGLYTYGPLF